MCPTTPAPTPPRSIRSDLGVDPNGTATTMCNCFASSSSSAIRPGSFDLLASTGDTVVRQAYDAAGVSCSPHWAVLHARACAECYRGHGAVRATQWDSKSPQCTREHLGTQVAQGKAEGCLISACRATAEWCTEDTPKWALPEAVDWQQIDPASHWLQAAAPARSAAGLRRSCPSWDASEHCLLCPAR